MAIKKIKKNDEKIILLKFKINNITKKRIGCGQEIQLLLKTVRIGLLYMLLLFVRFLLIWFLQIVSFFRVI